MVRSRSGPLPALRALLGAGVLCLLAPTPDAAGALPAGSGISPSPAPAPADTLGDVEFDVSCSAAVTGDFDRAVALLHHMMYQEARAAFEAVAADDPDCAMAHWGVAMTLFQPLWPTRPDAEARRRGWERLQTARSLGPGTDRERDLVAAAEAFFEDPGTEEWWPRIERWRDAMAESYEARPDDAETAAFYALSRLAAAQVSADRTAHNAEAAGILAKVHEQRPEHPGAIHYTIHANDVAGRADESPDVVSRYDEIAPSVPHALHMPSHIYVRLGDWPDVIEWNRRSADAARGRTVGDRISHHYLHALDYLVYAHLQQGEDDRARRVVREALSAGPHQESFVATFHLAAIPARFAVERRAWEEAAGLEPRTPGDRPWDSYPWPEGLTWFARGMGSAHTGDLAGARTAEERLEELGASAEEAGEEAFAVYLEIDRLVLSGLLAEADGDDGTAVDRMREAARLEGETEKDPVTPGSVLPPREALGELLLRLDRPDEALRAFEASLDVWPRRYHSLLGAARAAREAGDAETSASHYRALLEIAGGSDRAGAEEAAEFVGG